MSFFDETDQNVAFEHGHLSHVRDMYPVVRPDAQIDRHTHTHTHMLTLLIV